MNNKIDCKAFLTRTMAVALACVASIAFTGCSAIPYGNKLKPTVPEAARTSFVISVKKQAGTGTPTLDHVKDAFDSLFADVRTESDFKDRQDWSLKEAAAIGGGGAALGHLASQTGLLNTGLALAMVGLSVDSFYKPATTKATHLKAEDMFQCLQKELFFVSEDDRSLAIQAATDSEKAVTAVRDSINQVDSAITRYRLAILSQGPSMPSKDDFARFAKQYANDTTKANDLTVKFAPLVHGETTSLDVAEALVTATENIAATENLTDAAKAVNKAELEKFKAGRDAAKKRLILAQAGAAAAKFVPLAANLEACVKNFTP